MRNRKLDNIQPTATSREVSIFEICKCKGSTAP